MKIVNIILIAFCFAAIACQDEKTGDGIYYNDFETMGYWSNSQAIKKGAGRSGQFCTFTDDRAEYSETFRARIGDIKVSKPHLVTATAWVMTNDINAKSQLVLCLDSAGKNVVWNAALTQSVIITTGKWFEIKCSITLPERLDVDEKITMYGWRNGSGTVYFDDFLLKVE